MNKSVIYIVGATVLVGGGAYLFLKNKKAKDLAKLDEIGGATSGGSTSTGGSTSGGSTSGGSTSGGITPQITEPVKINKDLNLDAYNLQQLLEQIKELDKELKDKPRYNTSFGAKQSQEYYDWFKRVGNVKVYNQRKGVILDKLAKFGYKFDNGLLVKI
jgi:hypothetical protein